jgi:hypothetical protein
MSNLPDFLEIAELIAASNHPAAGLAVDIWHVERPTTLADLARLPAEMDFAVELNDALAEPVGDLYTDTIRNRVQVGEGALDVKGFIGTPNHSGSPGRGASRSSPTRTGNFHWTRRFDLIPVRPPAIRRGGLAADMTRQEMRDSGTQEVQR